VCIDQTSGSTSKTTSVWPCAGRQSKEQEKVVQEHAYDEMNDLFPRLISPCGTANVMPNHISIAKTVCSCSLRYEKLCLGLLTLHIAGPDVLFI
jgi:hypothetical protein